MAFSKTIDIWCEADGCSNWEFGCVDGSVAEARREVKKKGWTRGNGKDICPLCQQPEIGATSETR